jgi:hypothetical protein
MLEIASKRGNQLDVIASGKLDRQDYQALLPELERAIDEYGKVRLYLELRDFHGWLASGLWQEIKTDIRHRSHFEKTAVVGEDDIQRLAVQLADKLFSGPVRFFPKSQRAEARRWLARGAAA